MIPVQAHVVVYLAHLAFFILLIPIPNYLKGVNELRSLMHTYSTLSRRSLVQLFTEASEGGNLASLAQSLIKRMYKQPSTNRSCYLTFICHPGWKGQVSPEL